MQLSSISHVAPFGYVSSPFCAEIDTSARFKKLKNNPIFFWGKPNPIQTREKHGKTYFQLYFSPEFFPPLWPSFVQFEGLRLHRYFRLRGIPRITHIKRSILLRWQHNRVGEGRESATQKNHRISTFSNFRSTLEFSICNETLKSRRKVYVASAPAWYVAVLFLFHWQNRQFEVLPRFCHDNHAGQLTSQSGSAAPLGRPTLTAQSYTSSQEWRCLHWVDLSKCAFPSPIEFWF